MVTDSFNDLVGGRGTVFGLPRRVRVNRSNGGADLSRCGIRHMLGPGPRSGEPGPSTDFFSGLGGYRISKPDFKNDTGSPLVAKKNQVAIQTMLRTVDEPR